VEERGLRAGRERRGEKGGSRVYSQTWIKTSCSSQYFMNQPLSSSSELIPSLFLDFRQNFALETPKKNKRF
jgi:hypothetical protein